MDQDGIHVIAISGDRIISCGRGHFNSNDQAQIRYMVVDDDFRRQGIGTKILKVLEEELTEYGAKEIILKARENAVHFMKNRDTKSIRKVKFFLVKLSIIG